MYVYFYFITALHYFFFSFYFFFFFFVFLASLRPAVTSARQQTLKSFLHLFSQPHFYSRLQFVLPYSMYSGVTLFLSSFIYTQMLKCTTNSFEANQSTSLSPSPPLSLTLSISLFIYAYIYSYLLIDLSQSVRIYLSIYLSIYLNLFVYL